MEKFLDKLTSYNLFNYLLPGVLFIVALGKFTTFSFAIGDLIIGAFVAYFTGLVVSRFGSLVVGPILRKIKFVKFADYAEYVAASKKDAKIDTMSEENNMYRTINAMLILIVLVKILQAIENKYPVLKLWNVYALVFVLLAMFLFAYRKQTQFITKRVEAQK